MSSYDPAPVEDIITPDQFRQSMRLVRLQIAIPISVLISMGANLICALAIHPGLSGINALKPTLLTPNATMIGIYWAVLFVLQVGFCLMLLLVRKEVTKETLVNGVGLRFAVANWLQAIWAVCFTLQFFLGAEICLILNVINVLSIHLTLFRFPSTLTRPIDAVFIHGAMTMLLAILFELDWGHNGFITLNMVIRDEVAWSRWIGPAIGVILATNGVAAIWEGFTRQYWLAAASEYLLFAQLFVSPRTNPTLPSTAIPKPTGIIVTLIICLVLHPIAILAGVAWHRTKEREGRIRLEEEVEEAEREEEAAAAAAAAPARVGTVRRG